MKQKFLLIIIGIAWGTIVSAQRNEKKPGKPMEKNPPSFHSLMVSLDYASNTDILGNFNEQTKQPSFSPSFAYFSKWGLDATVTGFRVGNSDENYTSFSSELDVGAGYTYEPVENLSFYLSYVHFFYSANSNSLKSIFTNNYGLEMDYNYRFVGIGASSGFYTGSQHTFYASIRNYYLVNLENVFFRNASLSILPGIDINFGDYEYLNLYYLDKFRENSNFYSYLGLSRVVRRYIRAQQLKNPSLTEEEILDNYLASRAEDTFKLTSMSIGIPVSYLIGNFSINLGLYTYFPMGQPDYMTDDVQFYFNAGLTWLLSFDQGL